MSGVKKALFSIFCNPWNERGKNGRPVIQRSVTQDFTLFEGSIVPRRGI
jgi:hypothetical protein